MAITEGSKVTLDESDGLQNATATPTPTEDANDNDFSVNKTTYFGLPAPFVAQLTGSGALLDAALSGHTGAGGNLGSNAFTFTGTDVIGLAFSDANGDPLVDAPSGLKTVSGKDIKLYTSTGLTGNDNVVYGMVDGAPGTGTVAFAAYLEETGSPDISGAKIWMVQQQAILSPNVLVHDERVDLSGMVWVNITREQHFDFTGAPSGQNLFLMVGDANNGIVITGKDAANQSAGEAINTGDTVNTSQGGIGSTTVGNTNQMIDPGEGINLTYVTKPVSYLTVPNLDQGEADIEANIQYTDLKDDVFAASFDISQLQKAKTCSVKITAETTGAQPGVDFIGGVVDTKVAITSVVVMRGGTPVTTGITATDNAGVWTISGIKAGDTIEYHTATPHDRVLIENSPVGNAKASFDIGGVSLIGTSASTDQIGQLMRFEDSGPAILQATPDDSADVNTQDADTIGAAVNDTDTQSFAAAFTIDSSKYDTDGAGTTTWQYGFSLPNAAADSLLNSHGADIYLHLVGGKVIGSTEASPLNIATANTIFDLAVDSAGVVTMKQYFQIDHATPGVGSNFAAQQAILANGLIHLDATATITDGDGDTASSTKFIDLGGNLKFDDDGPGTFTPDSVTLVNSIGSTATDDLNSDGTEGADAGGTVKFVDDDATDALLRDTNGNVLQSDGEDITLSGFGTTMLTATAGGETVFVATIDNSAVDDYTITFSKSIDDGSGFVDFLGAAPVKSGNPTYNILPDVGDTSIDILFSGGDTAGGLPAAHSVNVSTTGAGTDNQSMNATGGKGDLLRMDFSTGASLAGSPVGKDFNLGTHETVNGFSFLLSQNTPSGTTGTMYVRAYDADPDKILVGDGTDDPFDPVTKVSVNGVVVFENGSSTNATINGKTVTAIGYLGGVVLTGLSEGQTGDGTGGDDPVIKVSTGDGFNRVEVSNYSGQTVGGNVLGGGDFDISPAGFEIPQAGNAFSFNLPVRNYDFDEDFSPIALIGVNMTPEPLP